MIRLLFCWLWLCLLGPAQALAAVLPPTDTAGLRARLAATRRQLTRHTDSAVAASRQLVRASQHLRFAPGLAQSYLLLAMGLRNGGAFDSSFYYGRRAQNLFEALNRPADLSAVHNLYAQTYKRMGDAQQVKVFTRRGLQQARLALYLAQRAHSPLAAETALLSQGILYRDLQQPDSARACYQQAIALAQAQPTASVSLGTAYANLGQLLMDSYHRLPEAVGLFRRALVLHHRVGNRNGLEHAYRQLSWAYRGLGQPTRAVAAADTCLALGRAIGDPHRLDNSLEASYLAYRDAGRYPTALHLLEEHKRLGDELGRLEKTQAVARIEAAYKAEKQQAHIAQLGLDNARQRTQLWGLGLSLAVVAALLGLSFWQSRLIRRANARLKATNLTISNNNQRIQEQAGRLTLLLRELHHRVKNNLAIVSSLLNLQAGRLTDPAAVRAVREGQQRIDTMSLLHQRLYQTADVTTVDMRAFVEDLTTHLLSAYGHNPARFDLVLEVELPPLDVDRAVPLGLLLNELTTNALKHAYACVAHPRLRVHLTAAPGAQAGGLLLEVEDNGPGLAPGQWQATAPSFGWQLIQALSEQLGGRLTVANAPGAFFQVIS